MSAFPAPPFTRDGKLAPAPNEAERSLLYAELIARQGGTRAGSQRR